VFLVNWWLEHRLMTGNVSYVIANSARYQAYAIRRYGVPSTRTCVIYNGYDPDQFPSPHSATLRTALRQKLGLTDDAVAFLFVSQDFTRKGLDLVIQAMPAVLRMHPRSWLIVVGKGRPARFLRLAQRLGIDRRVIFTGSSPDIESYYAMADALVLPTRFDPFANVCLEAMACGLPVVTSRINGASELIREGENGYVVEDPTDTEQLSARMCRLLDASHRNTLGHHSSRTAREFSLDRHIRNIEGYFERIRAEQQPAHALRAGLRQLDAELTVNTVFLPLLRQHGLDRFETLMGYGEGIPVKDRKGKQIFQLRLEWEGTPLVFYLKRHRVPLNWSQRAACAMRRRPVTEGRREWENILAFHDNLIPTAVPIAVGERILRGGVEESFVLMKGLEEYESLDRTAPKRFVAPLTRSLIQEKRMLIRSIAELTNRMHWAGFYHRDYYWAHLMLHKQPSETPDLHLIDLQRVIVRPWWPYRWKVKDLAALHYSFRGLGLTRTDKMRFLGAYNGAESHNRSLMQAIQRKTDRIARHDRRRIVS
jgi:tRNA A-37 threonylcarbamoyl transferase component Bud32